MKDYEMLKSYIWRLFLLSQHHLDLKENWMLIWMSSRPTWSPTQGSISHLPAMLPSSLPARQTMRNTVWQSWPMLCLSQLTRWLCVIQDMASTWPAVFSTEEMLLPKMSTRWLPTWKPRELYSSLTGFLLALRLATTMSQWQWFLDPTWPKWRDPVPCCPTQLLFQLPGPDLMLNLTSCMPRGLLFIGKRIFEQINHLLIFMANIFK